MLRNPVILLVLSLCVAVTAVAEGTRTWEQSKYETFLKGTSHGVAISSDGFLQLAPEFKMIASTPSSAVWATAVGPHGEIYAATGAPARVYRSAIKNRLARYVHIHGLLSAPKGETMRGRVIPLSKSTYL